MGLPTISLMRLRSSVLGGENVRHRSIKYGDLRLPGSAGPAEVADAARRRRGRRLARRERPDRRDLLATCRFTYDGRKRRLMISY